MLPDQGSGTGKERKELEKAAGGQSGNMELMQEAEARAEARSWGKQLKGAAGNRSWSKKVKSKKLKKGAGTSIFEISIIIMLTTGILIQLLLSHLHPFTAPSMLPAATKTYDLLSP